MSRTAILDDVTIAHVLRQALWAEWGERSVPVMWGRTGHQEVHVLGTDGRKWVVTVEEKHDV